MNEDADRLLQAWREKKSELGIGRSKHVFTTLKGAPVKDSYLREVCARKGKEAGIEWRVHPHALRHTFATDLLEDTGDLALVQDALGHSDPETTRIYAKVRNGRLARAMTGRKEAAAEPEETENMDEIQALKRQVAELTAKLEALAKGRT